MRRKREKVSREGSEGGESGASAHLAASFDLRRWGMGRIAGVNRAADAEEATTPHHSSCAPVTYLLPRAGLK